METVNWLVIVFMLFLPNAILLLYCVLSARQRTKSRQEKMEDTVYELNRRMARIEGRIGIREEK